MTKSFFAFRAYNTETLYGWGAAADAEEYADALNRNREINVFGVYPLTTEEAAELNLEDRTDVADMAAANFARGEEDSEQIVSSVEFTRHGYHSEAELLIQPNRGRYIVELTLLPGEELRTVAWEPAEPDAQQLAIKFARDKPIACVLDAIEIDKARRAER